MLWILVIFLSVAVDVLSVNALKPRAASTVCSVGAFKPIKLFFLNKKETPRLNEDG